MRRIFIICTGQDDNIGDVVLRRRLLNSLRSHGALHIYLGAASAGFIDSLQLGELDTVYSRKDLWRDAAYASTNEIQTWLVNKPGEIVSTSQQLKAYLRNAVLAARVKRRGGKVLTLGVGHRDPRSLLAKFTTYLLGKSTILAWRDSTSAEGYKVGQLMPDWGFDERSGATGGAVRNLLTVSYRSDRPMLSPAALVAIQRFALRHSLEICVVTQVMRDQPRTEELAKRLNGKAVTWPLNRTHAEQEGVLRGIYSASQLVISDRLHVLILAAAEGAIPLCMTVYPEHKVSRHFTMLGVKDLSYDVSQLNFEAVDQLLERSLLTQHSVERGVGDARAQIIRVDSEIASLASAAA